MMKQNTQLPKHSSGAFRECKPNEHKRRDNKFGVTWCVKCGRLFTKPSGKELQENDKNIFNKWEN